MWTERPAEQGLSRQVPRGARKRRADRELELESRFAVRNDSNRHRFATLRAQRLKKFKIALRDWNCQSIFKRAACQTPIFMGHSEGPGLNISIEIDFFNRDWNFQSRLIFFNLWALRERLETARFESQGQKPFELLFSFFFPLFTSKSGFRLRNSIR